MVYIIEGGNNVDSLEFGEQIRLKLYLINSLVVITKGAGQFTVCTTRGMLGLGSIPRCVVL
jgi:hypothetical protein